LKDQLTQPLDDLRDYVGDLQVNVVINRPGFDDIEPFVLDRFGSVHTDKRFLVTTRAMGCTLSIRLPAPH